MPTAFLSADIYTGDPERPRAEAVLIKENTIAAVGSNEEIEALCPQTTEKINLHGRFLCPGFVDAHTHVWSLGYTLTMVDLRGLTSLNACQAAIARAAEDAEPGQWIIGRHWNQNIWEEGREPTRHDLDAVAPDNPAVMIRICGHASWVNTRALAAAGVDENTPEPFGGQIDREAGTNFPSGMIRETREVVENFIPEPDLEFRVQAFLNAQEIFLSQGITCVHSFETPADYRVIHEVEKRGLLNIRVYHTVHPEEMAEFDQWKNKQDRFQSEMLWHGHIKLFADGSLGARSAYLHQPYEGTGNCGISCMTPEQMTAAVVAAYETGRGVIFHAIGDRALSQSLDAIEAARKIVPGPFNGEYRDRIEHLQLTRISDLKRMKEMGIAASVQPMAILTDWEVARNIWGEERCNTAYAWKTMEDLGLRLMFSSDAPIEPISPTEGIQAAVTRKGFGAPPDPAWYPAQILSRETALKAYFEHGGWATGRDKEFGIIAPGRKADITILEKSPLRVPENEIKDIRAAATMVDGSIVFSNL
ncbi:MAG: amidohydrolase [Desulfobacter sp.]|nr:MAG: amidohydrolase [Desulfobacter sp.]